MHHFLFYSGYFFHLNIQAIYFNVLLHLQKEERQTIDLKLLWKHKNM